MVLLISFRWIGDNPRNSQKVLFVSAYENLSHKPNDLFYGQPRKGSHIQLISILTRVPHGPWAMVQFLVQMHEMAEDSVTNFLH